MKEKHAAKEAELLVVAKEEAKKKGKELPTDSQGNYVVK